MKPTHEIVCSVLCNVMCLQCDVIGLKEGHWEVHALSWGTGESIFYAPSPLNGLTYFYFVQDLYLFCKLTYFYKCMKSF